MSGRTKAAPLTQAEELRALTRELHEAAKDARAAARELREARDSVGQTAGETIQELLTVMRDHVEKLVKERTAELVASMHASARSIEQHHAELMGKKSPEEVYELVSRMVTDVVKDEDFAARVASHVLRKMPVPGEMRTW